jgi:hypothetical protein
VTIQNCVFEDLGGNAIFISGYAKDITIENCEFRNIGANSIAIVGRPKAVRSPQFAFHDSTDLDKMDRGLGPVRWPQEGEKGEKVSVGRRKREAESPLRQRLPLC